MTLPPKPVAVGERWLADTTGLVENRKDHHSQRVVEVIELTWVSQDYHAVEGFTQATKRRQAHKVNLPNNRLKRKA